MVEIFKTNVEDYSKCRVIIENLNKHFPFYLVNFDLDDCDRILRIESRNGNIEVDEIIDLVKSASTEIELLPD